MNSKSRPRFDVHTLRDLAGDGAFARGDVYFRDGVVDILGIEPGRVLARVAGTEDYRTIVTGQVPIMFEIKFDGAVVTPEADYALQARITVDNKIWFVNDERHSVDPAKPEPLKLVLKKVDQDAAAPPTLFDTTWLAEDIEGRGVIDNAQSTFSVAQDGKVGGRGGCNRYFAQAEIDGDNIKIGKAGATMMACAPALMDQERKFLDTLARAATFRIGGDGKLFLVDAKGADLIRFSATA